MVYMVLLVLVLPSCQEEAKEVSFRIKTEGFHLDVISAGPSDYPVKFNHRKSGGKVTFSGSDNLYKFNTGEEGIEDYLFRLPEGQYLMELGIPMASLYGQEAGSFISDPQTVTISEATDTIVVDAASNCAMFLVEDGSEQLDQGIFLIEWHSHADGYYRSYPLNWDSLTGRYYAYFTPDTVPYDPSAFLWFYSNDQFNLETALSTSGFMTGHQYQISILE